MKEAESGSFTLPGEAGYETLTLKMAEKWGADVIRDSDGTVLSEDIVKAGYDIYSTICITRDHNAWAKKNMDKLQQTFLVTEPVTAKESFLAVHLMEDFYHDQFCINDSSDALKYWEVYDRTAEKKVSSNFWVWMNESGNIVIQNVTPFHDYTVSFLAYRIWEEISMYNHVTNNWNKEHLMVIDPIHEETRKYLRKWLADWCVKHPDTDVVRFTSLFYNFVWIWGSSERKRNLFSDWGSYDFTVSPLALQLFKKKYGYALCAEDFINQGKLHATHMPPSKKQMDYMKFMNEFVTSFGKELVDIVHAYNKKAYVFYDDSWIGVEPYSELFETIGFDGLIKCVFSGYEARLCSGVKVNTHELRLHPYLFPVGLGGSPTFKEGGNPALDAQKYWQFIRRALLRQPVERIGLGGYLHLVEAFPDFCDYVEHLTNEFRSIKKMHEQSSVYKYPGKIAVLHSWGKLRSWSLSGHFHETYMHDLIHVNEALSGFPMDVSFINFEDIKNGKLKDFDIIINAGKASTAWSGGDAWRDADIAASIQEWVNNGGVFIGIGEPSAVEGFNRYFRMASVLGVDKDTGSRVCHGKWPVEVDAHLHSALLPEGAEVDSNEWLYLTDGEAKVIEQTRGLPAIVVKSYGSGKGIYLGSFKYTNQNSRLLLNLMLYGMNKSLDQKYLPSSVDVECAYYPEIKNMAVINNSGKRTQSAISTDAGKIEISLEPYEMKIIEVIDEILTGRKQRGD